jgi:predicted amidohydrolase
MKKIILLLVLGAIAYGFYILYKKPGGDSILTPRLIDFVNFGSKENPSQFGRTLKTVIACLPSRPSKRENVDNIKTTIEKALEDDIDLKLIVFGEASLGLYGGGDKYQRSVAETIPGPFTKMLAYYTMHYNIHIAVGLIELKEGRLYNSLVVVDPLGNVCAVHRKMLLHSIDEANGITKAEPNYQVVTIDGFRFGLAICADANDRWLFEQYKKENLDGLIAPVSSQVPGFSKWLNYWPYGKMYGTWILAANRYGREGEQEYDGTVFAASPRGYLNYAEIPNGNKMVAIIGK